MRATKSAPTDPDAALAHVAVSGRLSNVSALMKAAVILISGCQDNQTSMDGNRNGAFTEQLLGVWDNGTFNGSAATFHARIKRPCRALSRRIYSPWALRRNLLWNCHSRHELTEGARYSRASCGERSTATGDTSNWTHENHKRGSWGVLIYLAGDTDKGAEAVQHDLAEILRAGSPAQVHVVVQHDGPECAGRYVVGSRPTKDLPMQALGRLDSSATGPWSAFSAGGCRSARPSGSLWSCEARWCYRRRRRPGPRISSASFLSPTTKASSTGILM